MLLVAERFPLRNGDNDFLVLERQAHPPRSSPSPWKTTGHLACKVDAGWERSMGGSVMVGTKAGWGVGCEKVYAVVEGYLPVTNDQQRRGWMRR
jgi:hypothetical protein